MSTQVKVRTLKKVLKKCAPGYTWRDTRHKAIIEYRGRTSFVSGLHPKKGGRPKEIEIGYVHDVLKNLEISTKCARLYMPQLQNWTWEPEEDPSADAQD